MGWVSWNSYHGLHCSTMHLIQAQIRFPTQTHRSRSPTKRIFPGFVGSKGYERAGSEKREARSERRRAGR
jgi:hypothetical protein